MSIVLNVVAVLEKTNITAEDLKVFVWFWCSCCVNCHFLATHFCH